MGLEEGDFILTVQQSQRVKLFGCIVEYAQCRCLGTHEHNLLMIRHVDGYDASGMYTARR